MKTVAYLRTFVLSGADGHVALDVDLVGIGELETSVEVGLRVVFILDELESLHESPGGASTSIDQLHIGIICGEGEARLHSDSAHT